ncbi:MAG: YifB family Mg chelatase-like AAA ATPase [Candidatus Eisenbacteria bacterium]|nr:YifB family Mg chelatase-like AAA ATPase [Candidatus Eisenbacteria bacterium]
MSLSKVLTGALSGCDGFLIEVEACLTRGLPAFSTVGLPDVAVKESRERVMAAILNSGFSFPSKRLTVNLAPAGVRKEGASFDLPISIGILAVSGQLAADKLSEYIILGELALDGRLRPVRGVLPVAIAGKENGVNGIIVPHRNAEEASIVDGVETVPVRNLKEVVEFLSGRISRNELLTKVRPRAAEPETENEDMSDIRGQEYAKRALEVAAAGGHNVLMIGPPGAGKTMLARRLSSVLPPLTKEENLEVTKIYSVAAKLGKLGSTGLRRPFRSPHHTTSDAGMIGGGRLAGPGEISLAHRGVLFLDELPEFKRNVLESLRQPLEEGRVLVTRAAYAVTFPCSTMLVAAMNPCPCGYLGDETRECRCTPLQITNYLGRLSGPLIDRIDIHIHVRPPRFGELLGRASGETSELIRERVGTARGRQEARFGNDGRAVTNSAMNENDISKFVPLGSDSQELLRAAFSRLGLSARAYHRILKVARTIADLAGSDKVMVQHVSEAIQYRSLDFLHTSAL